MSTSCTFDFLLLPQQIFTQILCLLPVKSLGLCKCVSKPWRSLISQPHFIKTHLSKQAHTHPKLILISHEGHPFTITDKVYSSFEFFGTIYSVEFNVDIDTTHPPSGFCKKLDFQYPHKWLHVLGSCNGLLLVNDHELSMFLLNPTTLEAKQLQVSPFNAITPSRVYGFGFDAFTNDYKIVSLPFSYGFTTSDSRPPGANCLFIDVYSLKSNEWRRIRSCPCDYSLTHNESGVLVNGCLHWIARRSSDGLYKILAFDIAGERFLEVVPPSRVDNCEFRRHRLVVLGGCLCLVVIASQGPDVYRTGVWMMREYGVEDSWTTLSILCRSYSGAWCLFGNKKALLDDCDRTWAWGWKYGGQRKLVVYNFDDQTSTAMEVLDLPFLFDVGLTFVDSLVSPNEHYEIDCQKEASGANQEREQGVGSCCVGLTD